MMLARGLLAGAELVVVSPSALPLAEVGEEPITFSAWVPYQLRALWQLPPAELERCLRQLSAFKALILGGGPIDAALEASTERLPCPVYHTYGMTETLSHVALRRLNGPGASQWFSPLPGVALGQDERGCLRIKAAVTLGQWLQTNDLVSLEETEGATRFRWLGRADNVIISGGVKILPEVVEQQAQQWLLQELGYVPPHVALGLPHQALGQLLALVIANALSADQQAALTAFLKASLPPYHAPRQLVIVGEIPLTATGKPDRQALQRVLDMGNSLRL
jgi:o-succinylbenzoate---CoA ligase